MNIKVTKSQICSVAFSIYFFVEAMLPNSSLSRIMLFLFSFLSIFLLSKVYVNRQTVFYALFIAFAVINIISGHAVNKSTSLSLVVTCFINLVFLIALQTFIRSLDCTDDFFDIYILVTLLVTAFYLVYAIFDIIRSGSFNRIEGFINANKVAVFAAFSLIMLINKRLKKMKAPWWLIAVFVVAIIISGSRKGLIILLIGTYILIAFRKPKQLLKITAITAVIVLILYFAVMKIGFLYDLIGNRIETMMFFFQNADIEEGSFLSRQNYIDIAWERSKGNLLFGHGLGSFSLIPESYGSYCHNNYLEILYSLGIPGLILFYYPMVCTLIAIIKCIIKRNYSINIFIALLVPYLICDYMLVTYYIRIYLIIPFICNEYIQSEQGN